MSLRPALALLLLSACAEDPTPPPERPGPRHLIDSWDQVVVCDTPLADLSLATEVEVQGRESGAIEEFRTLELPWPARVTSLEVRTAEIEQPRRGTLAEVRESGGYALLPRRRHYEAERLLESDDPRDQAREYAGLRAGDALAWQVDLPGGELHLRVRARPFRPAPTDLIVTCNGAEACVLDGLAGDWEERVATFRVPAGTCRLAVQARDPEGRRQDGWLMLLDWIALETDWPETVVLSPQVSVEDTVVRYEALLPSAEEWLAVPDGREVAVLAVGGPLVAYDADGTELARREVEGSHLTPLTLSRPASRVRIVQPRARLLRFLTAADARLRDDVARDTRDAGPLPGELADRVLSRLESLHDRRAALLLPAPSRMTFALELHAGERLRFAVGVADPGGDARPPTAPRALQEAVRFHVLWTPEGGRERVLDTAQVLETGWQDREVEIPAELAGSGQLAFVTEGSVAEAAAFADPRVVPAAGGAARTRPNVVFYLVDTLRADRLGCYGGPNPTSPALDRMAADGFRLQRFHAIAAHTRPSTASALTGLLPTYHTVFGLDHSLPFSVRTMAELLRDAGYSCWAFVSSNQIAGRGLHFEQGFHRFVAPLGVASQEPHAPTSRALNETAFPWLDASADEPFFLYLHSLDPHTPYDPPPRTAGRFTAGSTDALTAEEMANLDTLGRSLRPGELEFLRSLYDEQILYQDQQIEALLAHLAAIGVLEDTVVVVFSDHGEEFAEHGQFYHGGRMWQELLHVPCVIHVPARWQERAGLHPRTIEERASLLDLVPTVVDLLGLDVPTTWQGRSFLPAMRGEDLEELPFLGEDREGIGCVMQGDQKLIWFDRRGKIEMQYGLFDLGADPAESTNLAERHPQRVESLQELVRQLHRDFERRGFEAGRSEVVELDAEALEQLRALGYLGDDVR